MKPVWTVAASTMTGVMILQSLAWAPAAFGAADWADSWNQPVAANEATDVELEIMAEAGYLDEKGRLRVDLFERDYAYLAVRVTTAEGRPVEGAVPAFSIEGSSRLLGPEEIAAEPRSSEMGMVDFAVVGGQMGLDRASVQVGEASTQVLINVISLQAAGFPAPPLVEGGIPWQDLTQARLRYQDNRLMAEFPDQIKARAGQTVKLSGFLTPLEPEMRPRHLLLTSNPPSCFFHVPGGPAGAVEVFAAEGIEVSWDPVVLEGRFEPQSSSELGVVYRLHDARVIKP